MRLFFSRDPSSSSSRGAKIGHGAKLPPEYYLERFLRNTTGRCATWTSETPACEWISVKCDTDGNLRELDWLKVDLVGTLDWAALPPTLTVVFLNGGRQKVLEGGVPSASLPSSLSTLMLNANRFSGPFDLTTLPRCLRKLDISRNGFSGGVELTQLPWSLTRLHGHQNRFTGEIDLSRLPPNLTSLQLEDNLLTGTVDARVLPSSLKILRLRGNGFEYFLGSDEQVKRLKIAVLGGVTTGEIPYAPDGTLPDGASGRWY